MRIQSHRAITVAVVAGLIVVGAGCGAAPRPAAPMPTVTPRKLATPAPSPTQPPTPTSDALMQAAEAAKSALAARLKLSAKDVSVLKMERAEWPDASLGCPEPGRMYTKAVTFGYVVILSAGGETYEYHKAQLGDALVLCDQKGGPPVSSIKIPDNARAVVDMATGELADRIGVKASEITVTEIEEVEWRNSSLGCPQPGMMYLQVITPGFRVVLKAGGVEYVYHTDKGRKIVQCQPAEGKRPLSAADAPYAPQSPEELARLDLADREGVAYEDIEIVSVEDVEWSDASLGCPEPGMMYAQVLTAGKRVILAIAQVKFEYHTDMGKRVVLCQANK